MDLKNLFLSFYFCSLPLQHGALCSVKKSHKHISCSSLIGSKQCKIWKYMLWNFQLGPSKSLNLGHITLKLFLGTGGQNNALYIIEESVVLSHLDAGTQAATEHILDTVFLKQNVRQVSYEDSTEQKDKALKHITVFFDHLTIQFCIPHLKLFQLILPYYRTLLNHIIVTLLRFTPPLILYKTLQSPYLSPSQK